MLPANWPPSEPCFSRRMNWPPFLWPAGRVSIGRPPPDNINRRRVPKTVSFSQRPPPEGCRALASGCQLLKVPATQMGTAVGRVNSKRTGISWESALRSLSWFLLCFIAGGLSGCGTLDLEECSICHHHNAPENLAKAMGCYPTKHSRIPPAREVWMAAVGAGSD